jgi:hypothetical protein
MTVTVLDLITRSIRLLGAINLGDTPEADESANGLLALNAMTDAWAAERLMLYTTARNVWPLEPGQQVYEIGPNAPDWAGPRPQRVDRAGLIIPDSDPTETLERPLHTIRTQAEYARIRIKGLQSTLPTKLYYDYWFSDPSPENASDADQGSAHVYLWPCPIQTGLSVALYTPYAIGQWNDLAQTVSLPPGYRRALAYNLALELAPEYDREPSPIVTAIAAESKEKIKAANLRAPRVRTDIGARRGAFDYLLGEER